MRGEDLETQDDQQGQLQREPAEAALTQRLTHSGKITFRAGMHHGARGWSRKANSILLASSSALVTAAEGTS